MSTLPQLEPYATEFDVIMMRRTLELAALGTGLVSPNPLVGCIVVSAGGEVVGEGTYIYDDVTHAEAIALEQAGEAARRASSYKTIALIMVAVLPLMVWAAWRYGHPAIVVQAASPAPHAAEIPPFATHAAPLSDDDPSEFTKGAGRLNRALDRFSNESPEAVLRRIHDENAAHGVSVCAFEWHKGEVSLIFGNQPGMEIGVTMTRCAEAVEKASK